MSRSELEADRLDAVRADKRYLLHLSFADGIDGRPSLRDIEDGTLRTFDHLGAMLSFLEEQRPAPRPFTAGPPATEQHGESENT